MYNALMPRLFGDFTDWLETDLFPIHPGHMIRVEDHLTDSEYQVRAELPGMDPDKDIQVRVDKGVLTIHAERREEAPAKQRTEFRYGLLERSVRLPANAVEGGVTATYANGILTVTVPLTMAEPTGRQIPVTKAA